MDPDTPQVDDFTHVLSRLRASLFDDPKPRPKPEQKHPLETRHEAHHEAAAELCLPEALALNAVSQPRSSFLPDRAQKIHDSYTSRLHTIDALLSAQISQSLTADSLTLRQKSFDAKLSAARQKLHLEKHLFDRRLEQQYATATSRLNELLFESAGELDKTQRRLLQLEARQRASKTSVDTGQPGRLGWRLMLERLQEDSLGAIAVEDLSGVAFKQAAEALKEVGVGREQVKFVASVRSPRAVEGGRKPKMRSDASSGETVDVVRCRYNDLTGANRLFRALTEHGSPKAEGQEKLAARFYRQLPHGTRELPMFAATTFLSSAALSWTSGSLELADERVYYCVDERAYNHSHFRLREEMVKGCRTRAAAEVAKALDEIYCKESCSRFSQAELLQEQDPWPVTSREGKHRDVAFFDTGEEADSLLRCFPDVLVAVGKDDFPYTFAAARVHELLETYRFGSWNQSTLKLDQRNSLRRAYSLSEPGVLRRLYVVCKTADGLSLRPVADAWMDELITVYIMRSSLHSSVINVFKDFKHDLTLLSPDSTGEKFLIALASDRAIQPVSKTSTSTSRLCAWRACLSKSEPGSQADSLCTFHASLRQRLSKINGSAAEIKRHLPRSGTTTLKLRRASDVTKASSLMSELLNGKLERTIEGFCKKAANAARPKPRRDSARKGLALAPDLESMTERLKTEINLCRRVLRVEKRVAAELQRYVSSGIFPSDELAQIRQEYSALNEERSSLVRQLDPIARESPSTGTLPSLDRKHLMKGRGRSKSKGKGSPTRLQMTSSGKQGNNYGSGGAKAECRYLVKDFARIMNEESGGDEKSEMKFVITKELPVDRVQVETELELEFCLRKLVILKQNRKDPIAIGEEKREQRRSSGTHMRFDSSGYPLPLTDSHGRGTTSHIS